MQNPLRFSPPSYTDAEVEAVSRCINNGWTGTGPVTNQFEKDFSAYKQVSNAVAVSSCTSALFLSLKSLSIGPGDEVITTAMTFCSTVNVIIHCGAKPVLCDINLKTPASNNSLKTSNITVYLLPGNAAIAFF